MFGTRLSRRPGEILTRFATSKNENFINVGHFSISFTYLNICLLQLSINLIGGRCFLQPNVPWRHPLQDSIPDDQRVKQYRPKVSDERQKK